MPVYHDFIWKDYEVSVRPTGWRRAFPCVPYLNGTNINLATTVNNQTNKKRKFLYTWVLYRWDGKNQIQQKADDKWFDSNPKSKIRDKLDIPYLSIPDHYYIHASLYDKQSDSRSSWQVVANFTLLPRDMFVLRVGIGTLLTILGAYLATCQSVWRQLTLMPQHTHIV